MSELCRSLTISGGCYVGKRAGSNIALRRIHCCAEQRIALGSAFCWQHAVFEGALTLPMSGPNHAVLESELFSPTGRFFFARSGPIGRRALRGSLLSRLPCVGNLLSS